MTENKAELAITHLEEAAHDLVPPKHEPTIKEVATFLATSGLIKAELRGKPADVAVVLMGADAYKVDRFVGLQDGFDIIKGKLAFTAAMMRALCQRSPICEYFQEIEHTDTHSTWETKRNGYPKPDRATFTMDDAKSLGYLSKDNWKKQSKVMLSARASSKLCRQVYSDLLFGMIYSSEELMDEGGSVAKVIDTESLEVAPDATKEEKLVKALEPDVAEATNEELAAALETDKGRSFGADEEPPEGEGFSLPGDEEPDEMPIEYQDKIQLS